MTVVWSNQRTVTAVRGVFVDEQLLICSHRLYCGLTALWPWAVMSLFISLWVTSLKVCPCNAVCRMHFKGKLLRALCLLMQWENRQDKSNFLFLLFKTCYMSFLRFTDSSHDNWMNTTENIINQINVFRSHSVSHSLWRQTQLCTAALFTMMVVGYDWLHVNKVSPHLWHMLFVFSHFLVSLTICLSLSFIAFPCSFIIVLRYSSSAHLFPLTYPQCLFNFLFHPSPTRAPIHLCSSTLLICLTLLFITCNLESILSKLDSILTYKSFFHSTLSAHHHYHHHHPGPAPAMHAISAFFIMLKYRGWNLINEAQA